MYQSTSYISQIIQSRIVKCLISRVNHNQISNIQTCHVVKHPISLRWVLSAHSDRWTHVRCCKFQILNVPGRSQILSLVIGARGDPALNICPNLGWLLSSGKRSVVGNRVKRSSSHQIHFEEVRHFCHSPHQYNIANTLLAVKQTTSRQTS